MLEKLKADVLENEFKKRAQSNPKYSLRAFARDLGVSHSLLSQMFAGKRAMSVEFNRKLLKELKLSQRERDILAMGLPVTNSKPTAKISLESFALISDWIHYAILSLLDVVEMKYTPTWISQRLNISEKKAKHAMRRLEKLGHITFDENGNARQGSAPIVVENDRTTEATQRFNRGLIEKALHSMEQDSFDTRDLSSIVFTMDPQFVPYTVERIRNFRRSLSNELENLGVRKEVYALTVQIFPLTRGEKKK